MARRWMSLEEILDPESDLKLGKEWVIAAIKLPIPQANETFWSHKVGCAIVSRQRCNPTSTTCLCMLHSVVMLLLWQNGQAVCECCCLLLLTLSNNRIEAAAGFVTMHNSCDSQLFLLSC